MKVAKKEAVTTFRMTEKEMERLKRVAEREDRSFASVVRVAVREYLDRHEKKSK